MSTATKKHYEKASLSVVKFETEEILWTSGFFGDEDDLTDANVKSIFSDQSSSQKNLVNPT